MSIREILKKYKTIEIELLLSHILGKPKEFLYLNPEKKLSSYQVIKLSSLIRRRQKGEPVAYILGYKDFCGLRFKVNKDVLIPRPETENLVDAVIASASEAIFVQNRLPRPAIGGARNDTLRILDLGTGSGCIAVSLAKRFQVSGFRFQITVSDISEKALQVAKANAKTHKIKVKFIKSNLLENIKFIPDILVANLPYLDKKWKTKSIESEPKLALFTEEKGLYLYRKLLEQIASQKNKPKVIFLEFDPRQKLILLKLIKKTLPSVQTKFYKDLRNLWRFVEVVIPKEVF